MSLPVANSRNSSTPHPEPETPGPSTNTSPVYMPLFVVPVAIHPSPIPPALSIHVAPTPARENISERL